MKINRWHLIITIVLLAVIGVMGTTANVFGQIEIPRSKPGDVDNPTPWPTVVLPLMTPVPSQTENQSQLDESSSAIQPLPAINPGDPFNLVIYGESVGENTALFTNRSAVIAIGTVKQVMPARWSTINGARPADPYAASSMESIYTPVLIEIEEYIKGKLSRRELLIFALGGTVGQDSVRVVTDDFNTFQQGERVVVFLSARKRSLNAIPTWDVVGKYKVTLEQRATNTYSDIPLQQLKEQIRQALNSRELPPGGIVPPATE